MLKSFARVSCNCLTQMGFHRIFINFVQGLRLYAHSGPHTVQNKFIPHVLFLGEKIGKSCLDCAWDLDNI